MIRLTNTKKKPVQNKKTIKLKTNGNGEAAHRPKLYSNHYKYLNISYYHFNFYCCSSSWQKLEDFQRCYTTKRQLEYMSMVKEYVTRKM